MKCFIENQTVYYTQDGTLYHTLIDCYNFFNTDDGTPVRENTDQTERIHRLVTDQPLAQDTEQLELF